MNLNDGVTSRRPAACAAWLEQTATQYTLRAFWTSCRVRGIDQSILNFAKDPADIRHIPPANPANATENRWREAGHC